MPLPKRLASGFNIFADLLMKVNKSKEPKTEPCGIPVHCDICPLKVWTFKSLLFVF